MERVSGKILLVYKYLGSRQVCKFMSEYTRTEYFLPRIFGSIVLWIQNILGDQKILQPKVLWIQNYFRIKKI